MLLIDLLIVLGTGFRLKRGKVWDYERHVYVIRQRDGSADDAAKSRILR
jgi:hypothetical protein